MPPTMILIGVCACAGARDLSEADMAARTGAARILRIGCFLRIFWAFLEVLASGRGSLWGRVFPAFSEAMRPPAPRGVNRGFVVQAGLEQGSLLIPASSGESAGQGPSGGVFLGEDRARECCKIVMDGVVHEDTLSAPGFYLLIASGKRLSHQARRVAAVTGLALILAAITASLSLLRLAEQFGRLSVPPLYDD